MGQDKRPKKLEEITNISNNLDYNILLDLSGMTDSLEINLNDIINQENILGDSSNIYQMITPKNFISTNSTESRLGTTKKASSDDIINRIQNKIITTQKIQNLLKSNNININNTNKSTYFEYESNGTSSFINLYYQNKLNSNVLLHGQIAVTFQNTTYAYGIYLKNIRLPLIDSVGSSFSVISDGSNWKKNINTCKTVDGYLLGIGFNQKFIAGYTYYLDFSINYNI